MLFVVSGRDHRDGLSHRLEVRPRHRAYYAALGDDLILAGPYLDDAGEPVGSMIVIRRGTRDVIQERLFRHPVVALGVEEGHVTLVSPEHMYQGPWNLLFEARCQ